MERTDTHPPKHDPRTEPLNATAQAALQRLEQAFPARPDTRPAVNR
ncbi:hypothetical protein [Streptomyces sp. NPDC006739]